MKIIQGKHGKCELLHAFMQKERKQEWVLIDVLENPSLWPLFGRVFTLKTSNPIAISELIRRLEENNIALNLNVTPDLIEEFLLTEAETKKNFIITAMGDEEYAVVIERYTTQKAFWKFNLFGRENTLAIYKDENK
jgi:hypothetical protein